MQVAECLTRAKCSICGGSGKHTHICNSCNGTGEDIICDDEGNGIAVTCKKMRWCGFG